MHEGRDVDAPALWRAVADLVAPPRCCACRARGRSPVCGRCAADAATLASAPCPRCGGRWCRPGGCWRRPASVRRSFAAFAYRGPIRELIAAGKLEGVRAVWPLLGRWCVASAPRFRADVVTWVPTEPRRLRHRGFDHAEELAAAVSEGRGVPTAPLLVSAPGQPDRGARGAGSPRPAFRPRRRLRDARVVLVDDVVTTGATALGAAAALRRCGAREVTLLTVARAGRQTLDGR